MNVRKDPRSVPGGTGGDAARKAAKPATKPYHTISLADLIVHKYSDQDALMKKADKIAREFINGELREGEMARIPKPGVYQLFFPKLTADAGALRCSVIAEQLAREVRKVNPATAALENDPEPAEQALRPRPRPALEPNHHEAATRALARMVQSTTTPDITITETDRAALGALKVAFHPVWHTKNNLITGYYCDVTRGNARLRLEDMPELLEHNTPEVATAKIDAAVYKQAARAMGYLLKEGLKALLIVPIHFSTVDRLRYIGTLLEAGQGLPDEAKSLVVMELKEFPRDLTNFRLREPVSYLRTRSRALLAQIGFETVDLEMFKGLGFHGVSVDLIQHEWKEQRLLKGFERLVEDAEEHKLQSFVHGIGSKSLVVAAIAAGVRYMDGSAVSDPVNNPHHIRPYEIDMLYQE
jgi:EAL domain-containing protein (putative c-di-GMP-specific phosphodiesterase class I)